MLNFDPISFSETALAKIKALILADGTPNLKLRIYIVGGGCSGFQYGFALDAKELNEDDIIMRKTTVSQEKKIENESKNENENENETVSVVVDALSAQYLVGALVDYNESLQGSQFVVRNPNAETTCGCGSSFSLK